MLVNMGKKSRRKREATLNFLRQNAAETVDVVEEEDPSYKTIANRPKEIAQLTLKHRFGGAHITRGNLRCVKIDSGVVEGMRRARRNQRGELFDGDTQIWAARDAIALNESDGDALDEYIGAVVGLQFPRMIGDKKTGGNLIGMLSMLRSVESQYARLSLKTVERWPRVRPHWKRFRRRLCRQHCFLLQLIQCQLDTSSIQTLSIKSPHRFFNGKTWCCIRCLRNFRVF